VQASSLNMKIIINASAVAGAEGIRPSSLRRAKRRQRPACGDSVNARCCLCSLFFEVVDLLGYAGRALWARLVSRLSSLRVYFEANFPHLVLSELGGAVGTAVGHTDAEFRTGIDHLDPSSLLSLWVYRSVGNLDELPSYQGKQV